MCQVDRSIKPNLICFTHDRQAYQAIMHIKLKSGRPELQGESCAPLSVQSVGLRGGKTNREWHYHYVSRPFPRLRMLPLAKLFFRLSRKCKRGGNSICCCTVVVCRIYPSGCVCI